MANFWELYDQAVREESGSGGIVGFTTVQLGFKVYVKGVPQAETFFPVMDMSSKDAFTVDKAKRKAEAQLFAKTHGAARDPQLGVQIRVRKDGAFSGGREATWQDDRFFNTDTWTDAAKEIVRPSIDKMGISLPWSGWARIGFADDPNQVKQGVMKDTDKDGNPRYSQIAYLTEVFANQEEAVAAVGVSASEVESASSIVDGIPGMESIKQFPVPVASGYDDTSWQIVLDAVAEQKGAPGAVVEFAKENFGVTLTLADVVKIRAG